MSKRNENRAWSDKVSNPAQIGGIETSVLDNGPGKGVRIAWVNTGSPLRYKVVVDRSLDIVDALYSCHSLAWLSRGGVTAPNPAARDGLEWLWSFGGGLLTTCGLSHIGGPESDEHGTRGLHGRVSNIPASVESIVQPDPQTGKSEMSITGIVNQAKVFGPALELRRTISSRLGEPAVRVHDVVTNRGNAAVPHMILYHCNFGWPLVDKGTELVWEGECHSRGDEADDALFASKHDCKVCSDVLDGHSGSGEACGFIDVTPDGNGMCSVGLRNNKLGLGVTMRYSKKQLPWLTNWQHWGAGEYVTALEPGTNAPIGQIGARKAGNLIQLAPGESRTYDLEIVVSELNGS